LIKIGRSHTTFRFITDRPFLWMTTDGTRLDWVNIEPNGDWLVRFSRMGSETEERFRVRGSDTKEGRLFQYASRDSLAKLPPDEMFGLTSCSVNLTGEDFIEIRVPAKREPWLGFRRVSKQKKPEFSLTEPKGKNEPKSKAVVQVKDAIKKMALESPPVGFEPAVPLREAIDTVNAYKVAEGDAMTLSISKRGRLKIEYTYGG
jgi:hypothetical protein